MASVCYTYHVHFWYHQNLHGDRISTEPTTVFVFTVILSSLKRFWLKIILDVIHSLNASQYTEPQWYTLFSTPYLVMKLNVCELKSCIDEKSYVQKGKNDGQNTLQNFGINDLGRTDGQTDK